MPYIGDVVSLREGNECWMEGCLHAPCKSVVSEVDSMGYETVPTCDLHREQLVRQLKEALLDGAECEDCGTTEDLRQYKDPDEGQCGEINIMCRPCVSKIIDSRYDDEEE